MNQMTFEEFLQDTLKEHLTPRELDTFIRDILVYRETGTWPFGEPTRKEKILHRALVEFYILVEKDMTIRYEEYLKTFQRPELDHK